ncbi:MAG: toxin-antitoxin system YwqK family antitoxin [Saprospiraceae bacterium]|nr:toxin-antitoxin system YwqK family antitoxin [Saprospiraceae bacterium]
MKRTIFLLFVVICFIACNPEVHTIRNQNGIVVLKITGPSADTSKPWNGLYEKFDSLGVIYETANFKDGQLHGERVIFEDGVLYASENYKHNVFHGPYKLFYPNGVLKLETQYDNGVMSGTLKAYYSDGSIKEIVQMENNEENGPFKEYHPNGQIKAVGTYKNGPNEHGELQMYDSLGVLVKTMICEEGICHTQWTKE